MKRLPGVSMDVKAHYSIPRWWKQLGVRGPLTDRRIAFFQWQGRYGPSRTLIMPRRERRQGQTAQSTGNRQIPRRISPHVSITGTLIARRVS